VKLMMTVFFISVTNKDNTMGLSWQLVLMSLAAGIAGNFQLGYLASVLSQPYAQVEAYINSSWTERSGAPISVGVLSNIMAALNIVNPIAQMLGQMVALYICDRLGRKKTALFGCLLIIPGCLLSFGAKYLHPVIELLFLGRLIWSLADGILVVNQTIWLVEASPAKYRGRVSSMQEVFASLGMFVLVIGYCKPYRTPLPLYGLKLNQCIQNYLSLE
jgi:MFS family permease